MLEVEGTPVRVKLWLLGVVNRLVDSGVYIVHSLLCTCVVTSMKRSTTSNDTSPYLGDVLIRLVFPCQSAWLWDSWTAFVHVCGCRHARVWVLCVLSVPSNVPGGPRQGFVQEMGALWDSLPPD